MDSDHITNRKVRLLFNEFGSDGYYIWSCLLSYGYGHWGYYFDMNDKDELELFASEYCKKHINLVKEVINGCLRRGLFSECVHELSNVLTSEMMQETFLIATTDRRSKGSVFNIVEQWLLLDFSEEHPSNILVVPLNNKILPPKKEIVPRKNPQIREDKNREEEKREDSAGAGAPAEGVGKKEKKQADPLPEFKNPFSENFLSAWQQWKAYKATEFKFSYKSVQSEQAAINELVKLSKGMEHVAEAIIHQSMAKGWKGLFELKDQVYANEQQRTAKQATGAGVSTGSILSKIDAMPD